MVFESLNPELYKITSKRFKDPTAPQRLAIPHILSGKDVLLLAQTSSGKTESAMLPVMSMLMSTKQKPIGALYITPLKSLNRDLLDRMMWWGEQTGLEISVRHGDTSQYERKMQLEFPPNLLITTLETLQPILTGKRFREHLRNVKWVILDEVHEMVDSKRGVQLTVALERLRELCGDFQTVMLSATVGDPKVVGRFFTGGRDCEIVKADTGKRIDIRVINPDAEPKDEKIAEKVFTSTETAARLRVIMEMIKESRSSIVFTNTRQFAEILSSRMKTIDKTFPVDVHHGSLSKDVRIRAEKDFKSEKLKALISTSSLQLGIDIGSVDLVIQYMSPRQVSQLVQRVGRAGHELSKVSRGVVVSYDEDDMFEGAVIARKSMAQEFEDFDIHEKPYDVLAHQILGMTLDLGRLEPEKVYNIVKRAWPYRDLTRKEFDEVCSQLNRLGLIFFDSTINKKRRGFDYYFQQLSTIPDMKNYKVFNMLTNSFVGVLDEEFIAVHGSVGTTFILKGEAYRIISIENDRVTVEPVVDVEAAIPGWEGELIPIPYSVSQEVGRLRGEIASAISKSGAKAAEKLVMSKYPVDGPCARKMVDVVKRQLKYGVVPDDKTILVENYEDIAVMHAPFGSKTNDTLGRLLASLLTNRIGSVGLKTDAYRIMITFQKRSPELMKEILMETKPDHLRSYVELSLSRSELFEWKFVHVAKRFGAFSRDAEFGKIRMKKIVDDYSGTPLFEETMKELETEKLDIQRATEVLRKIQSGDFKLVFKDGTSPLGMLGVEHKFAEIVGPEKPESEIFDLFKKRIMQTKVKMICVNCGEWAVTYHVSEIEDGMKCGRCKSRLLSPVNPKAIEAEKIVKKGISDSVSTENRKMWEKMKENADLFMVYKRKSVIALAARGVGPVTAKRLLSRMYKDEDGFLRAILDAERQFMKTKQFWSV